MGDVLANLQKLPEKCAAIVNGEAVIITRGVSGVETAPFGADSVPDYNQQRGITAAQRQAMEVGSAVGWDAEGADADHWLRTETLEGEETIPKFYTYIAPITLQISVTAQSEPIGAKIAEDKRTEFISRAKGLLSFIGPEIQDVMTDGELDLVETADLRD